MFTKVFVILLLAHAYKAQPKYVPPAALVEPFHPIGIRISIPDEPGIQLVAFHVKINDEMVGLEAGTIARDIPSAKRGRWTYHDRTTQLKKGDTIYYWIYVIYRGLGYNLVDQEHVVTDFYDYNGNKMHSNDDGCNVYPNATSSCQTLAYVSPFPSIQPLSPTGIRISIPDETGITLVAFHVKINDGFVGLEAGTIARDIVKPTNGQWIYQDNSTELRKGDTVHYWIYLIYNNLGYNLAEQKYIVEDFYDNDGNKLLSCSEPCNYYTNGKVKFVNNCATRCYIPPVPLIEPLTPAGIRMSIPDEEGIYLVAFHAKFNEEMVGMEAGTIARDIPKAKHGRWTYYDKTTQLKKGDTIYYWIHVVYRGLGYNLVDQEYKVTEFFDINGNNTTTESNHAETTTQSTTKNSTMQSTTMNTTTESSTKKTTIESSDKKKSTTSSSATIKSTSHVHGYAQAPRFVPPEPLIEPLSPIGIRISIPHEPGITLVAYHIKFNEEMVGLEAGTIARDIPRAKNGRWTYHDKTTQLYKGDIIYYWIHVVYRGLGYNLVDQEYTVTDFYDYSGNKIPSEDEGIVDGGSQNNDGSNNNNNNNGGPEVDNNAGWNDPGGNNNNNPGGQQVNDDLNNGGQGSGCKLSMTKQTDWTGRTWNPCAGEVLFYDDFKNWQAFQQKMWAHVERFPDPPDYEFNIYRYSYGNIDVKNGLKITPDLLRKEYADGDNFVQYGQLTLQQCTGKVGTSECSQQAQGFNVLPPVTSSRVDTRKAINFEYGRVEIRAKLPQGDWIYPLLMLEPLRKTNKSLSSLRIRIASANGNQELSTFDGRDLSGRILWGGVTGLNWASQIDSRDNMYLSTFYNPRLWADEYHNYEIIWSPDKIVLKVDGQMYYDKQVFLPKNVPFYLTLGVAVGGLNEFPDWLMSKGYAKPWRNIEAKALYNFFNATNTWHSTWKKGASSLNVEYVRITAL